MHRPRSFLITAIVATAVTACSAPPDGTAAGVATSDRPEAAPVAGGPGDSLLAAADRGRILGAPDAPVWVVIVSDFQCPFCKVWHDATFPALTREFVDPGTVRVAYVNLPLPQHQHARATAELALCAGAQGRFWEVHDALFDSQDVWSTLPAGTPFFDSLAVSAGVDRERLKRCTESGAIAPLVDADFQRSVAARVRSTPTFFIGNDIRLEGAQSIAAFRDAIAAAGRTGPPTESR